MTKSSAPATASCKGERSAVEIYGKAHTHLEDNNADELRASKVSHALRVTILANRIIELGGKPTMEGGL